jgi:hypothetical protein
MTTAQTTDRIDLQDDPEFKAVFDERSELEIEKAEGEAAFRAAEHAPKVTPIRDSAQRRANGESLDQIEADWRASDCENNSGKAYRRLLVLQQAVDIKTRQLETVRAAASHRVLKAYGYREKYVEVLWARYLDYVKSFQTDQAEEALRFKPIEANADFCGYAPACPAPVQAGDPDDPNTIAGCWWKSTKRDYPELEERARRHRRAG